MSNVLKYWWWFLVIGLMSIIAGIAILAKPLEGYVTLSILFAFVMMTTGLSQVFFSISSSRILRGWGWTLASGILDFALGAFLLMYPLVTMATLPYFVGFYLVFRAIYLIGISFDVKSLGAPGWGWLLTGGIVQIVLGFLTLYYPAAGAIAIVMVSGTAFLVNGFLSVVLAFQLKNLKSALEP